jgi:hypothetical protein
MLLPGAVLQSRRFGDWQRRGRSLDGNSQAICRTIIMVGDRSFDEVAHTLAVQVQRFPIRNDLTATDQPISQAIARSLATAPQA